MPPGTHIAEVFKPQPEGRDGLAAVRWKPGAGGLLSWAAPSCAPDGGPIDRDRGSLPCALGEQEGAAPYLALPRAMGYLLPGFESGRTTGQRSFLPLPTDW
jgi:hypothetical protein